MTYVPKHRGEPKTRYQINVVESERGWGRDEWVEEFSTFEEASARVREINSKNTALHAPDWYIQASNEIKETY